ncbi:MAG: alpha/beta hydrolase [Polyangiaceae bacterium]
MSSFAQPDGSEVVFEVEGRGPLVVLVHGLGSSRRRWDRQVPALVSAGFTVARLDLRGFGDSKSGVLRHGMSEFVSDVRGFIEQLSARPRDAEGDRRDVGGERQRPRLHLVGHSLGGMICQLIALELGERLASLALVATTSHNGARATAFAELMTRLAERGFDGVWGDGEQRRLAEPVLAAAFPGLSHPPIEMLRKGLEKPDQSLANAWRACKTFSVKDRLVELRCPVLVTHGTNDPLIPYRAGELIHEAIPGSRFFAEAGAGHSLPSSRAESFNVNLLAHLRDAESG